MDRNDAKQTNATFVSVMTWAARHGERTCVSEGGHKFSFADLLTCVEHNRAALAELGVGPGHLVLVSCTRRAPAIAAMLATWALGATYLPLSPNLPPRRRDLIMHLARPRAIFSDAVEAHGPALCTSLSEPANLLDPAASYVIFTSGSTGTPKGVIVGHEGLAALTRWHRQTTGILPGDVCSQVSELGFDASVWEIWGALSNGASLVVPTRDELLEPQRLRDFLIRNQVITGFVPTGLASGLLDEPWPDSTALRVLFTGGDRLTRWPEGRHPFQFINAYGPTECTVVATSQSLDPAANNGNAPPIGSPLPHVTTCVVGDDTKPVPPGRAGELWLAGPALALGYVGQDHSTAFVHRDLGIGPTRWYRTGDTVMMDDAEILHYVSRNDDQVQIGGRRTEPAEVAATLRAMPTVTNAVVFAWEVPSGAVRLAAAVTPDDVSSADVRRYLEPLLPTYMIPSDVLAMSRIPVTDRGKFDIAQLRGQLTAQATQPSCSLEPGQAIIAEDWRTACGASAAGAQDRLVDLGAGSLDLIALRARVAARLNAPVPPGVLSLTQTLEEQAAELARMVTIEPTRHSTGALEGPGSIGQEAIVFLEEIEGNSLKYQYQMVLEGEGAPDSDILAQAFRAVLLAQPALAARWRMSSSGLVGERAGLDQLMIAHHTVGFADVEKLVFQLVTHPIRYNDFPLVALDVVHHERGTTVLQREHHLIHDGWSVGVFLDDLQQAYNAHAAGRDWTGPVSGLTYFDWAKRQREWLQGPGGDRARAYWVERLQGLTNRRKPVPWSTSLDVAGTQSKTHLQPLGVQRSVAVRSTAADLGVTSYALLLAAFRRLLVECRMGDDTIIGSAFANRDVEVRNVVGMFVHTLPLRRRTDPAETVAESARAEMAGISEALQWQALPTAEIIRVTSPKRSLDDPALYQVCFSQHDAPQPKLTFGNWRPAVRELWNGHGKADLNVIVMNRGIQHARHHADPHRSTSDYTLRWEFDPAVVPSRIVTTLGRLFTLLLDHACASPNAAWPTNIHDWERISS